MREKKLKCVDPGSGDVLVDLGLPDADERNLRVQLAVRLNELMTARRLTQAQAAHLLGISQPRVSELKNYKLGEFSSERLQQFVTLLDSGVGIDIDDLIGCVSGGPPDLSERTSEKFRQLLVSPLGTTSEAGFMG